MEDKDYKVTAIDPAPPKEYTNSFGTTYYRNVRIADASGTEHPKPVSLGKKDPNAFQVGMELHGHVLVEASFPTDKFKSVSKQQASFGGGGFSKPSGTGYSSGPKPAYKDNSDGQRQGMCFNNAAAYVSRHDPLKSPEGWAKEVYEYANALYKLGDLGGETPDPKVQSQQSPQTGQSDEDDPEMQSLYNSVASSDLPEGW